MLELLKNELNSIGIPFEENFPLKKITWIKRGGVAKFLCRPQSASDLKMLCKFLRKKNIDFDVFGGTSNLYCRESYNPAVVVSTLNVNKYNFDSECIECDCGVQSAVLSKKCCEKGLRGFEGLVSLPGTIGGAVCNNSGAFGCCISDNLQSVLLIDECGVEKELKKTDLFFSHRSSVLKNKILAGTIISCKFKKIKTDENLLQIAEKNIAVRKATQQGPLQNLGSVFTENRMRRVKRSDVSSLYAYIRYLLFLVWYKYFGRKIEKYKSSKKKFLLRLLGYSELDKYVSDKNLNCFVWSDDGADVAFVRYVEFMSRFNGTSKLEIEIRE